MDQITAGEQAVRRETVDETGIGDVVLINGNGPGKQRGQT
jgi:hypothetical protein